MIITIDGPVATGKTTIAKQLAKEIGFIYIETGAMYRCATLALLRAQIDLNDEEAVNKAINSFEFDMRLHHGECSYFLEGEDVSEEIRGHLVTDAVSTVAALAPVRKRLVVLQRQMVEGINAVCEGRDLGTFVFPHAALKIFLSGNDEVRAKRRYDEMCKRFPEEASQKTIEQVKKEIVERDNYDMNRAISPLKQPIDAIVIDTSHQTLDEIIQIIVDYKDDMPVTPESKS